MKSDKAPALPARELAHLGVEKLSAGYGAFMVLRELTLDLRVERCADRRERCDVLVEAVAGDRQSSIEPAHAVSDDVDACIELFDLQR